VFPNIFGTIPTRLPVVVSDAEVIGDQHMSSSDDDTADPPTDRMHDNSWSVDLEKPRYADDPELAVRHGIDAIEHTVSGNHVNLVTHRDLGHPEQFLFDALAKEYGEDETEWEYVTQCGCGGHVTRVHVE
jgi:putative CGCGG family rSAM target protein